MEFSLQGNSLRFRRVLYIYWMYWLCPKQYEIVFLFNLYFIFLIYILLFLIASSQIQRAAYDLHV